eukprot:TRINITY_DN162341_c0_g1_i1.p1 TRINITY_DN162341_c0_g1~~TRINITY_DN162341_c0_g1_i1.p1  ORF type:complete len:279 (+),score=67.58 TRINITY_DN162341_c0_g1_i1:68-904(+)
MIEDANPIFQTLLGTLLTWGLTAVGAALVFVIPNVSSKRKAMIMDVSMGFAGGVMFAASVWSLLEPALEMIDDKNILEVSIVLLGFIFGVYFVVLADKILPDNIVPEHELASIAKKSEGDESVLVNAKKTFHRTLLLVTAITMHNIPEGLAVGVTFAAIGRAPSATFANAVHLVWAIGIQNFPEGLAVSLPLSSAGFGKCKSFMYGQLSGIVEPLVGVLGALAVTLVEPILPFALAFAAGAMIFVVINELIPHCSDRSVSSFSFIFGFLLMMVLEVCI